MTRHWAALAVAAALLVPVLPARGQGAPGGESPPGIPGKLLFLRCASCHAITAAIPGQPAPAKIGPNLYGVVGRKAGSLPGYSYSPAMRAEDFVWDPATLDRWLTRPTSVVPGTAMAFAGLPSAAERQALIAYLAENGK